jgi:hypothetical protein
MSRTHTLIKNWIMSAIPCGLKDPIEEILEFLLKNEETGLVGGALRNYLMKSKTVDKIHFVTKKSINIDNIQLILDNHHVKYNLRYKYSDYNRVKLVLDQLKIDLILVDNLSQYQSKCFDINCLRILWDGKSNITFPIEISYVDVFSKGLLKKLSVDYMTKNNFDINVKRMIKMIDDGWSLPMDNLIFREKILRLMENMTPDQLCKITPQIINCLHKEVKNILDANRRYLADHKKKIIMKSYKYKPLLLSSCCLPDYLDIAHLFINVFPINETLGMKIYSLAPEKINNTTWFQLSKILQNYS